MHSFASALIAAALVTLTSAAPLNIPAGNITSVSSAPLPTQFPDRLPLVRPPQPPQANSVEGKVKSSAGGVQVRDIEIIDAVKHIQSKVSKIDTRADILSVAVTFNDLETQIQPYVEQLASIGPSDADITYINNIVASIEAPIVAAVPQIQALAGQEASVILKAVDGVTDLTVSQVAHLVASDVNAILEAAGDVLKVTNAQGDAITSAAKNTVTGLVSGVLDLVGAVVHVVDGVASSLGPLLETADSVVSDLGLSLSVTA